MGRVRRYKRIKAIDPFSKTGGVVDPDAGKVVNKAPTRKELTGDAVPRSVQLMLERRAAEAVPEQAARAVVGGHHRERDERGLQAGLDQADPVRHRG